MMTAHRRKILQERLNAILNDYENSDIRISRKAIMLTVRLDIEDIRKMLHNGILEEYLIVDHELLAEING